MKNSLFKCIILISAFSLVFSALVPSFAMAAPNDVANRNDIFEELRQDEDIKDIKVVNQNQIVVYFEDGNIVSVTRDKKTNKVTLDSNTMDNSEVVEMESMVNELISNFSEGLAQETEDGIMMAAKCSKYKYVTTLKGSNKFQKAALKVALTALMLIIGQKFVVGGLAILLSVIDDILPRDQYVKTDVYYKKCGKKITAKYISKYYKKSNYTGYIRTQTRYKTVNLR
ncbi:hypothetical protein [Desmospora profundinema]|uniref:Uncharacterized protein n=1 Tax=Desmospora profundinema TaxID=1571184 RepID=A0ABU1INE4_9BACL|nr:hypothetical protein [Desmospora profundinema]MDR6226302.1 hypothetical protein [Desmospora profundinema]